MPGRHKDKFGLARLTYLPPVLTTKDINELYRDWLAHLTRRMNPHLPGNGNPEQNGSYARLASAKLFDLLELNLAQCAEGQVQDPLLMAIPHIAKKVGVGANARDNATIPLDDLNRFARSGPSSNGLEPLDLSELFHSNKREIAVLALSYISAALSTFLNGEQLSECEQRIVAKASELLRKALQNAAQQQASNDAALERDLADADRRVKNANEQIATVTTQLNSARLTETNVKSQTESTQRQIKEFQSQLSEALATPKAKSEGAAPPDISAAMREIVAANRSLAALSKAQATLRKSFTDVQNGALRRKRPSAPRKRKGGTRKTPYARRSERRRRQRNLPMPRSSSNRNSAMSSGKTSSHRSSRN